MRLSRYLIITVFFPAVLFAQQHPSTFFTKAEANEVRANLKRYPLLTASYQEIKSDVDKWLGKNVDVPVPKDPAGGYTHDKHKSNYMLMFNSGVLYQLTGDTRYAKLVSDMMLKYANLNPTLGKHPEATSSSPGRIFWQALNDANWLVYAGMAYDLVRDFISATDRKKIEDGAFRPEVEYFTKDLTSWFNLIHNHGVWACAGVGIAGIATDNNEWVDMALYGTEKKGGAGFITQMDGLFSPDGYYTEGPYYVRYAILPYYLFATALNNARPSLKIFQHRDRILQKALMAGLQQTNLDGTFFSFNDALKEKDYTSNELVTAVDAAWAMYGKNDGLLVVAQKQGRVLLNRGGVSIAATLAASKNVTRNFPYETVEYRDGKNGDEGGVSVLRNGKNEKLSTLIFKYTAHGLSHGHYDKLNIQFFDKGNEIISDYGAVRFIGIEQKYGGRYLPETKTYAAQTIAHNTLVVDEQSHFDAKEFESEKYHADKQYSILSKPNALVVGAETGKAYKDVKLQRTIYMLQLPTGRKLLVDIFNALSSKPHQYDLPFHYNGQFISSTARYQSFDTKQETLGRKNGYQHLWKEAVSEVNDSIYQFTFLNNRTYYSITSLIQGKATIFHTRSGASDPSFNIRHEPAMIIRKNGNDIPFINVIETHGSFDPIGEFSSGSYSAVSDIRLLRNDLDYTIVSTIVDGKTLEIAQANREFDKGTPHRLYVNNKTYTWTGPSFTWWDGKELK